VPFEGNFSNRIMGGYSRKGNQSSSIVEGGGSSPVIERGDDVFSGDMASTVGSMKHWSARKGDLEQVPLLASSKQGFLTKLSEAQLNAQAFYQAVVEDRLRRLRFSAFSDSGEGLPEVIILSEQLLEWPEHLTVMGHSYTRCGHLALKSHLQEMAAFVLLGKAWEYQFSSATRAGKFKTKFEETWLLVSKGGLTVACVHLTSKYTSSSASQSAGIFDDVFQFARTKKVQAILGDFNLNTYGVHGGAFPVSSKFGMDGDGLSLKTKFASSSGSGDKAYMGGLICDPRVSLLPTLSTFGCCALPPWFTGDLAPALKKFAKKVFSDHHSLYCRYAFYDTGRPPLIGPSRAKGGGDCFFEALKAKLPGSHAWKASSVAQLRTDLIGAISNSVLADPHYDSGHYILKQVVGTDYALPFWCEDVESFVAEMAQPGRWVEDNLLPYVAAIMQIQFVIQYGHGYAVFDVGGQREDHPGLAPLDLPGIHMNCADNHFW
jgi:hypothetical protein